MQQYFSKLKSMFYVICFIVHVEKAVIFLGINS